MAPIEGLYTDRDVLGRRGHLDLKLGGSTRVKLELGEKQNWVDSNDLAMLYRGPYPQEFYRLLHGRVHYEFRARRALRRPSFRGLAMMPRNLAALIRSEIRLRRYL